MPGGREVGSSQGEGGDERRDEIAEDKRRTATALSTSETVSRYGSGNAEYIKGYTGVDNETGQKFAKGLKGIAEGKVHPDFAEQNLKQQAGYSAEVATTSRDNAEAIIAKSDVRVSRSDDLPHYGRNHTVIDRVKVLNGEIIEGTQSQMKFVGSRENLFNDITKPDGKFARYRGVKLELPSEQYEGARDFCLERAEKLRQNALRAEQNGKPDAAQRLREQAENYDQLADQVVDSGLTTEQAIFYRNHPKLATARDIAKTSHRAGMEGAKFGAVIGGSISIITNAFAIAQEGKHFGDAAKDLALDTVKAGGIGYATAFTGSAIKGAMQQSGSTYARALARTNAPALAVQVVLSLGVSVNRYVQGEIDEAQFLGEVGEKGAGMLSGAMFAALGQIAIPIPFVGAAVGSMIGYTLSSMFYQAALGAARDVAAAKANLARVIEIETAARAEIEKQRVALDDFMRKELPELELETRELFASIARHDAGDVDAFAADINKYANLLGAQLQFKSQMEFDQFMTTNEPLRL